MVHMSIIMIVFEEKKQVNSESVKVLSYRVCVFFKKNWGRICLLDVKKIPHDLPLQKIHVGKN
jgi:hypothetical protein